MRAGVAAVAVVVWGMACRPSIPENNYPSDAATESPVAEAEMKWREVSREVDKSLPRLDSCNADHLRIRTNVPEDRFREICHRCGIGRCGEQGGCPDRLQRFGCAGACLELYCADAVFQCNPRYVAAVHKAAEDVRAVVYHELVHWMSECSGHSEQFPYDRGDRGHRDCLLWGEGGVLDRLGGPVRPCQGTP